MLFKFCFYLFFPSKSFESTKSLRTVFQRKRKPPTKRTTSRLHQSSPLNAAKNNPDRFEISLIFLFRESISSFNFLPLISVYEKQMKRPQKESSLPMPMVYFPSKPQSPFLYILNKNEINNGSNISPLNFFSFCVILFEFYNTLSFWFKYLIKLTSIWKWTLNLIFLYLIKTSN